MTSKQIRILGNITYLKEHKMDNELAYYLEGLETAGVSERLLNKLIDKANYKLWQDGYIC